MGKLRERLVVSFRAKVLLPMPIVMFLLLAVTVWVVNRQITQQMLRDAKLTLSKAKTTVLTLQDKRRESLLATGQLLAKQPKYRSALQKEDESTVNDTLGHVLLDTGVDVVMFTPYNENAAPSHAPFLERRTDLKISLAEFEKATLPAVRYAVEGVATNDTIQLSDRLYEVVSIPVVANDGENSARYGVLTLGSEIGPKVVSEVKRVTDSLIELLASGSVSPSSSQLSEPGETFVELFKNLTVKAGGKDLPSDPIPRVFRGQNFFCSAGFFPSLSDDRSLGYLLLNPYDEPLNALENTRLAIIGVSLLAIVIGSVVVWLVVSRATHPLEELRDSAEAVGQGDFSRRVKVRSRDECGQLAQVFNQMTENVKQSREELQLTVDTLRTTQAQLIQSEKLSGIGEFVAGVAHELNNPLTSVLGFSELLAADNLDPRHKRYLDRVQKSAERCQKIVQALLSFARRHKPERKAVCVNSLIEAALEILTYQLRTSNIQVTTQLDPRLPLAMVDPHQIQQVFLNLINNARQAIEAHLPKGWIKITSSANGQVVRVTVQDSGPGITPENLSKIFDPFFTTKELGKGTGLGLSLCYGIIREHGGTILPRSQPGEGATFIIELPITHETTPQPAEPSVAPEHGIIDRREGAGKRVLVIDDEKPILHLVREALTARGYQVDLATDGEPGCAA